MSAPTAPPVQAASPAPGPDPASLPARPTRPARPRWGTLVELPLLGALTSWLAMWSWRGFTAEASGFLFPLLFIALVLALSGTTLRWRRVPGLAVVAIQVVVATVLTTLVIDGTLLPGRGLADALSRAGDAATVYAAPVPHTDVVDLHPLLLLGGVAVVLLVDVIASSLRRVSLAGLPLLAAYAVPVSMLGHAPSWWVFAATAAGFLTMLFADTQRQVGRWGRAISARDEDDPAWRPHNDAVRATATSVGVVAVLVAVAVPAAVPALHLSVFAFGPGDGDGSSIEVNNPIVDLRRDLRQGPDVPLIQISTEDPTPSYLQISVLNRYSGDQWSSGDRDVPSDHQPDGVLPALEGVNASVKRQSYDYSVRVLPSFHSTWLPTQAPISSIRADGDWRYDTSTMDFIAGSGGVDASGSDYTMTAVKLKLKAAQLRRDSTRLATVSPELTFLPAGLPSVIGTDALDVTKNAETPFDQAVALQDWFRKNFTYSLDAPSGNSAGDLATFLTPGKDGRTGYCEQFAASMAVMARYLGIPARVAIGFLQPTPVAGASSTWEYSAHDLHAWPELYFEGAGWVRFDPTPGDRVDSVPDYTAGGPDTIRTTSPTVAPSSQAANTGRPQPTTSPSAAPDDRPEVTVPEAVAGADHSTLWTSLAIGAGAALLLVAAVLAPGWMRRGRRRRRLVGGAEDAWDELRDTMRDLRLDWPHGRSPQASAAIVARYFEHRRVPHGAAAPDGAAGQQDAAPALARITAAVERVRYSQGRADAASGTLAHDVESCRASLGRAAGDGAMRRARWWPSSVFSSHRAPRGSSLTSPMNVERI